MKKWIEHQQPYSWRQGDGPWNNDTVVLWSRYLIPERYFTAEIEQRHPGADIMMLTAFNYDRPAHVRPPPELICPYEGPTGRLVGLE